MPSRNKEIERGHPILFGFKQAREFDDWQDGGGYPKSFLTLAYETLGVTSPQRVLHLCSGSVRVGITIDVRSEAKPSVIADCRRTPFMDESFDWIMADPPYSREWAKNLYGTDRFYPQPKQILIEAMRLLRPGGKVGILHFQVPMSPPNCKMLNFYGVSTGAGYAIRAWTVFQKPEGLSLFGQ